MMSDENGQTPQGKYPAPPPGSMAPPPPPPGAPAPAPQQPAPAPAQYPAQQPVAAPMPVQQPAPVAQPQYVPPGPQPYQGAQQYAPAGMQQPPAAPKKRKGWVIALIIGLVLVCGIGSCIAVALFAAGSGSGDKEKITQAETHYSAAENAVQKVEASIKTAAAAKSPEEISAAVKESANNLQVSRDELAAAKASIEQLKDSPGKTSYLESLAAATSAVDGLQDLVGYLDTASGMSAKSTEAGNLTKQANDDMEAAIKLGNKSSYTAMRAKAVAAAALYAKATFLFEEADKLDPTAGLKKAATYAGKRRQQADVVVRMAESGKAGRLSAYNADIKKQAALSKAAEAAGIPAIVSDPNWAANRLAELSKTIEADAAKADELHKKALVELKYTP